MHLANKAIRGSAITNYERATGFYEQVIFHRRQRAVAIELFAFIGAPGGLGDHFDDDDGMILKGIVAEFGWQVTCTSGC